MPPRLVGDMSAADLEQYQMWLEYQKPMYMELHREEEGEWGICGRCGAPLIQLMRLTDDGRHVVFTASQAQWPKFCRACGQRVKHGEDDE